METIAYRYRIRRVLSDEQRVRDEIWAGHCLYNDLVAIERERRRATSLYWAERGGYAQLLTDIDAAVERAKAQPPKSAERKAAWQSVDVLRREIWDRERAAIAGQDDAPRARRKARAKELRAEAKARGEKLTPKQLAYALDSDQECLTPRDQLRLKLVREYEARGVGVSAATVAARMREAGLAGPTEHIDAKARQAAYRAYQARGVSPGTREVITTAHAKSLDDVGLGEQRFARWDGSGAFGVQIHGGASVESLLGGEHTQAQLRKLPPQGRITAGSRKDCRYELRVRIGSDGRAPVWAVFDADLHRPLPPSAKVMRVRVLLERVGVHDQWHAVFTMQVADTVYRRSEPARVGGAVAVDIGWRSTEGNLRVGYVMDRRGFSEPIELPTMLGRDSMRRTLRERNAHARGLQSVLSVALCGSESPGIAEPGGIVRDLGDWLDAHRSALPEWLAEASKDVRRWRSGERVNRLAERWLSNRFEGDGEIVARLDGWRRQWRHLYEWECRERRRVLAVRSAHYRAVALRLARDYDTIVINGADLASARKRKSAKQAAPELVMVEDRKRAQAFDAAPGELREEIVRAAKKYGRAVVPVAFDSMTCHGCGGACDYDRARKLCHTCEHCGLGWDQDANACRNALRLSVARMARLSRTGLHPREIVDN